MSVSISRDGPVTIVTIDRPDRRNAVDTATARALYDAFQAFDADETASVAVLTGSGGAFCAGADLKAVAKGAGNRVERTGDFGPLGPTRLRLSKPVIAAIEGHAVAGGLELALWCDLRVAARSAVFGVFCRRFGVPLIDLGTVRLPRLIGGSRAMDMILTGRAVDAEEALAMGLANRVVADGEALAAAVILARQIAAFDSETAHVIGFPGCFPNPYAQKMMERLCTHPNVGAVLLVSLGCESFDRVESFRVLLEFRSRQGFDLLYFIIQVR
jgi:enoyl-CoA hydratase